MSDIWEQIDQLDISTVFDSLDLTKDEVQALKSAPKEIVDLVNVEMARYTPLDTPYAIRDKVVLKSMAQLLIKIPAIIKAIQTGYNNG